MYQSKWYFAKNDILAVAADVRAKHPAAWAEVTKPHPASRTFIALVAAECQRLVNMDIGCNLKRGGPEVSLDVLAMPNATGARDASGKFAGLELVDIIMGAESSNASIGWADVTQATIDGGTVGGWIAPDAVLDGGSEAPPASTMPSYEAMGGDEGGKQVTRLMEADYLRAEKPGLDGDSGAWQWRTAYDFLSGKFKTVAASAAAHQPEWRGALNAERASLGKPPINW